MLTYNQMTKKIESFDKKFDMLYKMQQELKEQGYDSGVILLGDIINDLCCYKNYLIFEKRYKAVGLKELDNNEEVKKE